MYPGPKRDDINAWERFFRTLLAALNPRSYHVLSQRPLLQTLRYFPGVLVFGIAVMLLLAIPNIMNLPPYIQSQFNSFSSLSIDVTQEMNGPFVLTQTTPLLTIDTTGSTDPTDSRVLITGDTVTYHILPFTDPVSVPLGEGDLLINSGNIANLAWGVLLLLLPGLLLVLFVLLAIKYFLLAIAAAFLGFILTGIIRFQIRFSQLLNVGLYATTIAIIIELLTKPFLVSSFYLHYVFFAIYFILGMIGAGDFEPTHPKRVKREE